MRCDDLIPELDRLVAGEDGSPAVLRHLSGCPPCRARVERARDVARLLREAAPEPVPEELDRRIRAECRPQGRSLSLPLKVAAALLLVAGGAWGYLVWSGAGVSAKSFRRWDLQLEVMGESGLPVEEYALEQMYGPDTPILLAGVGENGDRETR